MSDDDKKTPPLKLRDIANAARAALTDKERAILDQRMADKPAVKPEGPTLFGRPVDAFVKGGTHTSQHDKEVAKNFAAAEHRRAVADQERVLASKSIEEGGAMMATHKMTTAPQAEALYVLLKYLTPKGDEVFHKGKELQGLADLQIVGPDELQLMIVCMGCKESGRHQESCQLAIRQSNKSWHLDRTPWDGQSKSFPHRTGQPFFFDGKMYMSAGVVMAMEKFRCPDCHWTARIDGNCVRPER